MACRGMTQIDMRLNGVCFDCLDFPDLRKMYPSLLQNVDQLYNNYKNLQCLLLIRWRFFNSQNYLKVHNKWNIFDLSSRYRYFWDFTKHFGQKFQFKTPNFVWFCQNISRAHRSGLYKRLKEIWQKHPYDLLSPHSGARASIPSPRISGACSSTQSTALSPRQAGSFAYFSPSVQ